MHKSLYTGIGISVHFWSENAFEMKMNKCRVFINSQPQLMQLDFFLVGFGLTNSNIIKISRYFFFYFYFFVCELQRQSRRQPVAYISVVTPRPRCSRTPGLLSTFCVTLFAFCEFRCCFCCCLCGKGSCRIFPLST